MERKRVSDEEENFSLKFGFNRKRYFLKQPAANLATTTAKAAKAATTAATTTAATTAIFLFESKVGILTFAMGSTLFFVPYRIRL